MIVIDDNTLMTTNNEFRSRTRMKIDNDMQNTHGDKQESTLKVDDMDRQYGRCIKVEKDKEH